MVKKRLGHLLVSVVRLHNSSLILIFSFIVVFLRTQRPRLLAQKKAMRNQFLNFTTLIYMETNRRAEIYSYFPCAVLYLLEVRYVDHK